MQAVLIRNMTRLSWIILSKPNPNSTQLKATLRDTVKNKYEVLLYAQNKLTAELQNYP